MARHAGQGSGAGRATRARTRSSATTSSIRSTTTSSRTKRRSRRCAAAIDRITNHILDNNYQLIDVDGKRTRWGWWGPDAIWEDPDETGLRALHMLSHLRVALHMTAQRAVPSAVSGGVRRSRSRRTSTTGSRATRRSWSRAHQSLGRRAGVSVVLPAAALRERIRRCSTVYKQSLERSWQIERPERNPLWNVIYAAGTGATEFDRAESLRTLREIPMDTIEWTVRNSHRLDVPIDPLSDRFKRRQALIVLPYDELPMSKWNGNPYNLDGGNGGRSEDDGAYFLLPYWMGRYHQLIGR